MSDLNILCGLKPSRIPNLEFKAVCKGKVVNFGHIDVRCIDHRKVGSVEVDCSVLSSYSQSIVVGEICSVEKDRAAWYF